MYSFPSVIGLIMVALHGVLMVGGRRWVWEKVVGYGMS